jgi:hypothetical protein
VIMPRLRIIIAAPALAMLWLATARGVGLSIRQTPAPQSSAASLDLPAYLLELDRWAAAARRVVSRPETAVELGRQVPPAWHVVIQGQKFNISTSDLRRDLDQAAADPDTAEAAAADIGFRIAQLRDSALAAGTPASLDPGRVRRTVDEVLSRREFAGVRGPSWWDDARQRAFNWLGNQLLRLFGRLGAHPTAQNAFVWFLGIVLVLLLLYALGRTFLSRPFHTSLNLEGSASPVRTWRDWVREAQQAAARSDHREAVHLAYWAAVYRLADLGLLRVDRSRTHRQYLRQFADASAVPTPVEPGVVRRDAFAGLTSTFERVWYAGQAASAEEYELVKNRLEALDCSLD